MGNVLSDIHSWWKSPVGNTDITGWELLALVVVVVTVVVLWMRVLRDMDLEIA